MKPPLKREDLVYADECYAIVGALIEVYKKLGSGYPEKYYQRAVAEEFKLREISFKEQLSVPLMYKDVKVGKYIFDFLIEIGEARIVLELKRGEQFLKNNIDQVLGYLKSKQLKLGILANFTSKGVVFKRIVNI